MKNIVFKIEGENVGGNDHGHQFEVKVNFDIDNERIIDRSFNQKIYSESQKASFRIELINQVDEFIKLLSIKRL